ncbi:hypothetical protein ACWKT5_02420 [Streptomyces avermitilis]
MSCLYRPETALCRSTRLAAGLATDGPDESRCRSACTNRAYIDRDISTLRDQLSRLDGAAHDPLSPLPLRDRAKAQADRLSTVVTRHKETRPVNLP